jgi:aspartate racemase
VAKTGTLGVVGGMGPLASAEFVKTIYEYSLGGREQDSPVVLMNSDPTFPDRTQSLLKGESEPLLNKLIEALNGLRELGASKIVICCITIHYLLPKLPAELRRRIISLIDVIMEQVAKDRKKRLLISTVGARKLGIYERHARWNEVKDRIVLPDEKDQNLIHNEIIYQVKRNRDIICLAPILESLLLKYDLDSFIAGCTEIHLFSKYLVSSGSEARLGCIDPLITIAKELAQSSNSIETEGDILLTTAKM